MSVRVRGVYATALTRLLLEADCRVVQASAAIRERFDAEFPAADHDAAVDATRDRRGVTVEGEPDAVGAVAGRLAAVGVDAFAWEADAPRGAVFDGRVTDTGGPGATVDIGEGRGFLPFDSADGYVEEGDRVRVQVADSRPPWSREDPLLDTALRAPAGLATLLRDDGPAVTVAGGGRAAERELAGLTELLGVEVPDGWRVRWAPAAADAGVDALEAALERAVETAERVEAARDEPAGDPRRLAAPLSATHVWFGRASRFALDEVRRGVTTTMPGHHRTKAAAEAAGAGVDLAEALCDPTGEFPFAAVTRQFGPREGDAVRIAHGKPDGRLVVLGRGEVTDRDPDGGVEVRREMTAGGSYDALDADREAGDTAHTTFREGRWWYPTVYRGDEGARKGTYVNVCTPLELFPEAVRYVDLQVDVVKERDGTVRRVDDEELAADVEAGLVDADLAEKARSVASSIETALAE